MPEPAKQPIERNPSWTDTENEAIVADYLDMFREHVEGQRVRKKEHRLTLIENGLKRSEASIEFKHRNISAVLAGMGYPYLPGYRPAWNYQRPLLDMVEILKPSESFLAGAEAALRQGLILENEEIDPTDVFVKEPTTEPKQKEAREGLRRMLRKIDPATRDMRLREIGAAGEAFVLDVERARMVDFKRPDLVAEVKQVSLSDDGAGYDIRSFDHNGEERFIEVKTTPGAVATPFFLTANELDVSRSTKGWTLYRVHQFQNHRRILELTPPLEDRVTLAAAVWNARLRPESGVKGV